MKRYLVIGAFAVAVLSGGCQSNKASSRGQLTPAVTDISPAPPAPVYVAPAQPVQPVQPVAIATPSDGAAPAATLAGGSYTVQRGDTLYKIAREHYGDGKQWTRIASANPGLSPQSLKVGQKITIP